MSSVAIPVLTVDCRAHAAQQGAAADAGSLGSAEVSVKQIALVLSLFLVILGAIGIIRPEAFLGVARFQTPAGFSVVAAVRIVLGVALLFAASTSRVPGVIRVLGTLLLVTGLITPFIGPPERIRAIVNWGS